MHSPSYHAFTGLRGPRLTLSRLSADEVAEATETLYSPTTWVVAHREKDSKEKVRAYIGGFVERDARFEGLTVVARVAATGELAALSRFHSAGPGFTRVEIGYSWVADRWQRTFVNTEKKFLMLRHAFETMGVKRVEFAVDPINEKSNAAMTRLGARLEGTLRKWRFLNDSDRGDRNIYSVIDDEWPELKARFEERLRKYT